MRKVKNVRRQQVCLKVPKVGSLEKAENCTQKTHQKSGSRHSSQNCRLRKQRTSLVGDSIHRGSPNTVGGQTKLRGYWNLLNPGPQRLFMMPVTDISCKYFFPPKLEGWPSEHVGSGGESRTMLILSPLSPPCLSPSLPFSLLPNT